MSKSQKNEKVVARKRVISVVARVEKAAEKCERVGSDKVAYPPFLMQYDARSEGERVVKARVRKCDEK